MTDLEKLGWTDFFQKQYDEVLKSGEFSGNLIPARISVEHLSNYKLYSQYGELSGTLAGKFHHLSEGHKTFPVVGDWVLANLILEEKKAVIQKLLNRHTKFSRKEAGLKTDEQVIAANIDIIFLMTSMNKEFNRRRIERYLAVIHESGAKPVIILSKADLAEDEEFFHNEIREISSDLPVQITSSKLHEGIDDVKKYFERGVTTAVIGSSGVGKSTFINELIGEEYLQIQSISEYKDRGTHTTTKRELIQLREGGLIIDTPGMREIQLYEIEDGLGEVFDDIEKFSLECKFSDCRHETEPGCAVRSAIESGDLTEEKLKSYNKLQREIKRAETNKDKREKTLEKRKFKKISKNIKSFYKKNKDSKRY